jgi:hypothetical protein
VEQEEHEQQCYLRLLYDTDKNNNMTDDIRNSDGSNNSCNQNGIIMIFYGVTRESGPQLVARKFAPPGL